MIDKVNGMIFESGNTPMSIKKLGLSNTTFFP